MPLSGIALVTGGAGFIGSHIARALIDAGARVRIIDDLSTGYPENLNEIGGDVEFINASITERRAQVWFSVSWLEPAVDRSDGRGAVGGGDFELSQPGACCQASRWQNHLSRC